MPGQIWKKKSLAEKYPEKFGTNPFPEGSKGWTKWNELNPAAAEQAAAAAAVAPLNAASPSFWSPEYGGIPATASPVTSAATAIGGNVANMPALQGLASGVNQFNLGQQLEQYNTALPGYSGMVAQSAGNIGSRLQGQIPQDVVDQITNQAAARGVSMGVPGSPFSNAELIKSLGLTSLGLQTQAENELTQAINRTPAVPLFNTASFLVSPQDQQAAQQQANLMAAAPVPAKAQQTALDIARAGMQAGAASVPTPQFQTPQQSNSYSLVSDILSRYSPQQQAPAQQAQTAYQVPAQPLSTAPAPSYDVFGAQPNNSISQDILGSLGFGDFGYGTIPDFVSPSGNGFQSSSWDIPNNFGIWG